MELKTKKIMGFSLLLILLGSGVGIGFFIGNLRLTNNQENNVIEDNLYIPWELVFLPDNELLFTERIGNIRLIDPEISNDSSIILTLDDVYMDFQGSSGLLGLTIDPNFTQNGFVYIYYTYMNNDTQKINKVVRYTKTTNILDSPMIIIDNIPGDHHNGGRIRFGPDNMLYILTGASHNESLAQDLNSLAGKILRVYANGSIPLDNPFTNSSVYSLGHRDPQGIAWDNNGRLWATEHGEITKDEINLIEPGKNYGWPLIEGNETQSNLETPIISSGSTTWAPSGLLYYNNSLYFAGLRGESIYKIKNIDDYPSINLSVESFLKEKYGRLRTITIGPDGFFYILTSNRGTDKVQVNDDKIIRINPDLL